MKFFSRELPNTLQYDEMSVADILSVTASLNRLLTDETELLRAMRLREIAPLQAEKLKLSAKLSQFQKRLATDAHALGEVDDTSRDQLRAMTETLTATIEENMQRTAIARTVNQYALKTITETIVERENPGQYRSTGHAATGANITISVNINERA